MANINNPAHAVTGTCRLSYCNLTQPKPRQNGEEPRYSVTVLLPKSDTAAKQRLDAAIEAAAQRGTGELWSGVRPPQLPIPIYDGDGARPSDGTGFGPECKGHWVFTASTKTLPPAALVDSNLQPIMQATDIYSGMYGRVGVTFFPYFKQGKKGVGCALDNVQKLADGEPLSGRATAQDDFGAMPQQAAPVASMQQYQPQQPAAYPMAQPPAYQPPMYPPQTQTAPGYPQQPQIDPITGQPVGGVYGI